MNRVIAWFAGNHVAANLLMFFIIGMGIWAVIGGINVGEYKQYLRDTDERFELESREIPGLGRAIVVGSTVSPVSGLMFSANVGPI